MSNEARTLAYKVNAQYMDEASLNHLDKLYHYLGGMINDGGSVLGASTTSYNGREYMDEFAIDSARKQDVLSYLNDNHLQNHLSYFEVILENDPVTNTMVEIETKELFPSNHKKEESFAMSFNHDELDDIEDEEEEDVIPVGSFSGFQDMLSSPPPQQQSSPPIQEQPSQQNDNHSHGHHDIIDELLPTQHDIVNQLNTTLDVDPTVLNNPQLMMMRSQYESSLATIFMMAGDSLSKVQSMNVDDDLKQFKSSVLSNPSPKYVEYQSLVETKEQVMGNLERDIEDIRSKYTRGLDAWIESKVADLEQEYRQTYPDTTEQEIQTIMINIKPQLEEFNNVLEQKKKELKQSLTLDFIRQSGNPDMEKAMQFLITKENFQEQLKTLSKSFEGQENTSFKESQQYVEPEPVVHEPTPTPTPHHEPILEEEVTLEESQNLAEQLTADISDLADDMIDELDDDLDDISNIEVDDVIDDTIDDTPDMSDEELQYEIEKIMGDIDEEVEANVTDNEPPINQVADVSFEVDTFEDGHEDEVVSFNEEYAELGIPQSDDDDFDETPEYEYSEDFIEEDDSDNQDKKKGGWKFIVLIIAMVIMLGVGLYFLANTFGIIGDKEPKQEQTTPSSNKEDKKDESKSDDSTDKSDKSNDSKDDKKSEKVDGQDIEIGDSLGVNINNKNVDVTVVEIEPDGSVVTKDKEGNLYQITKEQLEALSE